MSGRPPSGGPTPSALTRAFARWLLLLPGWFRERFEADMVDDFTAGVASIRKAQGRLASALYALRAFADVPREAWALRRQREPVGFSPRPRTARPTRLLLDDLGFAARGLLRAPGWTGTALVILTLGIGGTAAVFTVLNAVLLQPLPFHEADRLVSIWSVNEEQGLPDGSSWENARDWVDRAGSLDEVSLVFRPEFTNATVADGGDPQRLQIGLVTANFFEMLGIEAVEGRVFRSADQDEDPRIAVITTALWGERYGYDPEVIGSTLTIAGGDTRIVGVVPSEIEIPRRDTQVFELLDPRPSDGRSRRHSDAYWVLGRLSPASSPREAQTELVRIARELEAEYPEANGGRGVRLTPLREEIVGDRVPMLLWTLFGSMSLVLLIGGTNVAQLMLSRGVRRRREMAVRASLGATRARLNRQLLLEGALLSIAAAAGGLALARLGLDGLVAMIPPGVPLSGEVTIDWRVLLLGFGLSAVVAPLVGLLPALRSSRIGAAETLRPGGRGVAGGDQRARSGLVVAQVTMAVILLTSSGLLVRSAQAIQAIDPGFDADRTLMARVHLSPRNPGDLATVQASLTSRLEGLPEVSQVAIMGRFFIERIPDQTIEIVGLPAPEDRASRPRLTTDVVFPGFFEKLGIPLLRGRALSPADLAEEGNAVLVNRAWVEAFAGDRDPVGLQLHWGGRPDDSPLEVVGVVENLRRTALEAPPYPQMFLPAADDGIDVLVGTPDEPLAVGPTLRRLVRELDDGAAISYLGVAADRYDLGLAPRRTQTLLFGVFAALATLLAAIGLFAILHDAVASRRREIGIRIALGASPGGVRTLVLRRGMGLSGLGLLIGVAGATALSGVTSRLVYGVKTFDPTTLVGVTVLLAGVSLVASALPARQATRVSPAESLGSE